MTNSRLAAMDARIHRVAARAGIADTCSFRTKAGILFEDVACFVLRGVQTTADQVTIVSNRTLVDLVRRAGLPEPANGDSVILDDGTYKVDALQVSDESRYQVLLTKARA